MINGSSDILPWSIGALNSSSSVWLFCIVVTLPEDYYVIDVINKPVETTLARRKAEDRVLAVEKVPHILLGLFCCSFSTAVVFFLFRPT